MRASFIAPVALVFVACAGGDVGQEFEVKQATPSATATALPVSPAPTTAAPVTGPTTPPALSVYVAGQPLTPTDTAGYVTGDLLELFFLDRAGLCSRGTVRSNAKSMRLALRLPSGGLKPGTFDIAGDNTGAGKGTARFSVSDATCQVRAETDALATGGTVTIDDVSASQVTGTADVRFGSGVARGKFSVALCASAAPNACLAD